MLKFLGLIHYQWRQNHLSGEKPTKKPPSFLDLFHADDFDPIKAGPRRCHVRTSPLQDGRNWEKGRLAIKSLSGNSSSQQEGQEDSGSG